MWNTAATRKYKSIIKENKKNHSKKVLSVKTNTNSIKVLIPKALIDSSISHDVFALIDNATKEYNYIK